jgi:predicted nuclease of restriction endonuclease-like (RecB) superfamily
MELNSAAYKQFFEEIKEQIRKSQYEAMKLVNKALIDLYWTIGNMIVEKQEEQGWGKSIVETLADDLQKEYPGMQGYSTVNLWRMRKFYLEYKGVTKLSPLVREIGWSHNTVIIDKCKDNLEREFYIKMTKKFGWTKAVLIHQIENKHYEKFLLNQTNFDKTITADYSAQAKLAIKDEYSFDFLEMSDDYKERELELGLIKNIRKFLMEMGSDFAFMGSQYRIIVDDEAFFIDLLLYHRRLQSMIAIDLKVEKFKPEHVGKMQFYLTTLDEQIKQAYENPSIGIIICKEKNRTIVEYALKDANKPIGVATYTIKDSLPEAVRNYLPTPEEIAERLESFFEGNNEGKTRKLV